MFSLEFDTYNRVLAQKLKGEIVTEQDILALDHKLLRLHRANVYLTNEIHSDKPQIQNRKRQQKIQLLKITRETIQIQKLADQAGIRLMFQKGIVLDAILFDNQRVRISRDVDFLVHPDDVAKMHELLKAEGFHRNYPSFELTSVQNKSARKVLNQYAYYHSEKKITVEMHWRLFRNPRILNIPFDELWQHKNTVQIDVHNVYYLNHNTLALFLIVHACLHGWERNFWLVDIALLFKKFNKQDWENLRTLSEQHELIKPVQQALFLMEKWWNITFESGIPKASEEQIHFKSLKSFVIDTDHYLYTGAPQTNQKESIRYAAKMIGAKKVFPFHAFNYSVEDFETLPLPKNLFWMYPVIHPFTSLLRKKKGKGGQKNNQE